MAINSQKNQMALILIKVFLFEQKAYKMLPPGCGLFCSNK